MTRVLSGKKGQFYLFAAILICISAFSLLSTTAKPDTKSTAFDLVSKNYFNEAPNAINNALYEKNDVPTALDLYTRNFMEYAKTKNIEFKVAYMIKEDNKIKVVNYLRSEVNITSHNLTINPKESITINSTRLITIKYADIEYNYTFGNETIEFKALTMR